MDQYIIELTEGEIDILNDLATQITIIPSDEPEQFFELVKSLSNQIPNRIREHLLDFANRGSQSGYLLFRRIDVPSVESPPDNKRKIGEKTQLARIQALLISVIGQMIAYEAEGYGQLFQDVIPMPSLAQNQTSVGSNVELEIHTEQAFSRFRPDILSLACVRGDTNAITYILPVKTILQHMSRDEIKLLKESLWKTGVDLSFKLHGKEFEEGDIRGPMPIIYGSESDPLLTFDQDLMFSESEHGNHLLKKIVALYYEKRGQHNLSSGEIIFIDNNRAVHGRSPFSPKYDGKDRFLIRCFATFDYEKSAHVRVGRTVSAIYS